MVEIRAMSSELLGEIEKGIPSAGIGNPPCQVTDLSALAVPHGKNASERLPDYEVREIRQSLSVGGTRVNSPDASIHDGKEGHDLEKSIYDIGDINIFDPNRPKFKLSRRM